MTDNRSQFPQQLRHRERHPKARWKRRGIVGGLFLGLAALATTAAIAGPLAAVGAYVDPYHAKVQAAGYVQKSVRVNRITLSYVEGPDNGPPLVLLHAQLLDWFSYSRVLPELAKSFHVYDIDYPGHGQTITPADYPMTANQIGADLGDFIEKHIGRPVFVTGNSSGGLLATWLAAHRPKLIKAALLEDPPLFSAEYPRIKQTIADRAFRTSYAAATQDHPDDFLLYWTHGNAPFFRKNIGPGTPFILTQAVKAYRRANPGKPVEIGVVKNDTVRMLLRGLDRYDPRFGAAFYDGTWNKGFDHAEALKTITCPVLLMQANTSQLPDGTLNGAMSKEEADRAMSLLHKGKYLKVDATHVVNLDKPVEFTNALESFFLGR
ncbi:Pimeloyl-ACP methyl ester carboxylesterase [Faunimonas pinastri]|uniref:Pimeloyl-ACP methyl ester carboxylesterase n=2 Tax=Faunimonas pinastri TaxID=1855383 RepID=A0A1H9A6E5_9HYPH|nr:Pimeloyl-ACP methyl ester carboxylesterase [Faunimonas pinastri]